MNTSIARTCSTDCDNLDTNQALQEGAILSAVVCLILSPTEMDSYAEVVAQGNGLETEELVGS